MNERQIAKLHERAFPGRPSLVILLCCLPFERPCGTRRGALVATESSRTPAKGLGPFPRGAAHRPLGRLRHPAGSEQGGATGAPAGRALYGLPARESGVPDRGGGADPPLPLGRGRGTSACDTVTDCGTGRTPRAKVGAWKEPTHSRTSIRNRSRTDVKLLGEGLGFNSIDALECAVVFRGALRRDHRGRARGQRAHVRVGPEPGRLRAHAGR